MQNCGPPVAAMDVFKQQAMLLDAEHAQLIRVSTVSLLTPNPEVLRHPRVAGLAALAKATPAQIVFRFALAVAMLPLTGTPNAEWMKQNLASRDWVLSADAEIVDDHHASADERDAWCR